MRNLGLSLSHIHRTFIVLDTKLRRTAIAPKRFLQLLDSRSASFSTTRSVIWPAFGTTTDDAEKILAKCRGARDIFFIDFTKPTLLPLLPLRLGVPLAYLFHPAPIEFAHPLFTRLTHLPLEHEDLTAEGYHGPGHAPIPHPSRLLFYGFAQVSSRCTGRLCASVGAHRSIC
ncbi:hypothetical protein C8R43DRAFT_1041148 [Mycena crocata]|nr:hypothetical protein C8R43DRAFT_1041148 [Mycena crocata]